MPVVLNGSVDPSQNNTKMMQTYLIDERESTALDVVFDELFSEVLKQIFQDAQIDPTIIKTKESNHK